MTLDPYRNRRALESLLPFPYLRGDLGSAEFFDPTGLNLIDRKSKSRAGGGIAPCTPTHVRFASLSCGTFGFGIRRPRAYRQEATLTC